MRACAYVYACTHLPVPASELFWEGLMKGHGRIRGWMYATLLENLKYAPVQWNLSKAKHLRAREQYPLRATVPYETAKISKIADGTDLFGVRGLVFDK